MAPPRIPGHESEDIVDMTPAYPPADEADDIVDMTPAYAPGETAVGASNGPSDGAGEDVMDMTPYAPDGEYASNGEAERPAATRAYAPDGDAHGQPAWEATAAYYGEREERPAMTAPPISKPKAPQGPQERFGSLAKAGKSRWKLIAAAVVGVIVVALVVKVLGQSSSIGGSPGAQSTAVSSTGTPGPTSTQPDSTTGPLILLNPGVVRQGAAVAVMGSGFDPGATVDLTLKRQASGSALASAVVKADQSGFFGDAAITVPMTLSSGNFFVEAHQRNSTKTVRATGTIAGGAPQVKLGTMVGKPGDLITITLHGFAPEESVNVYWNTMSGDPVTQLKADGGGSIGQAKIRVPFGAIGDNTFLFVGANSQSLVAANFLVLKMYPTIKLGSYALRADNVMSFSGSGFGPSERVLVFLNSPNTAPVAVVPTDDAGAFKNTTGFVVPFTLKGKQTLIFMGEQSRTPNEVAFTVLPYSPVVEPSTYGGFPGTTITFFATGFAHNEVVHVYVGHEANNMGNMVACFQSDDKGNAGGVGSYLIPGGAQGKLGFALVGAKSGGVGVASVNVSAPPFPVHTPPQPPFTCPLDPPPTPQQQQQPQSSLAAPAAALPRPLAAGVAAMALTVSWADSTPPSGHAVADGAPVLSPAASPAASPAIQTPMARRGHEQPRLTPLTLELWMMWLVALVTVTLIRYEADSARRKTRYLVGSARGRVSIGRPWATLPALAGASALLRFGGIERDRTPWSGGPGHSGSGLVQTRARPRARLPAPQAPPRRMRQTEDRRLRVRLPHGVAIGTLRQIGPWAWRLAGHAHELALLVAALALTRLLSLDLWRLPVGDVGLYYRYAQLFWTSQPRLHALPVEYPPLAILPFSLTLLPASRDYTTPYAYWMGALVVVGYLGFLRYSTQRRAIVYALYLLVGATATLLARFDIVPALLTLAALWATQRRRFSYAYLLIAAGALIKLYPIFLLPVVLIADARAATLEAQATSSFVAPGEQARDARLGRWRQGGPGAMAKWMWTQPAAPRIARGVALCLGLVLLGFAGAFALNPANALSSFSYASARPLQVESIPASLLWLGTFIGIPAGPVFSFSSLNYVGPLDVYLKPLSALALLAVCGVIYVRQARGRLSVGQAFLACLCAVIATNKIFSPQYLIWVLPIVAVVEGFDLLWLAICVLTTLDYPILYLTQPTFAAVTHTPAFLPLLAARNLLIIAATARAVSRTADRAKTPFVAHLDRLGAWDGLQAAAAVPRPFMAGSLIMAVPRPFMAGSVIIAFGRHALESARSRLGRVIPGRVIPGPIIPKGIIPRQASLGSMGKFLIVGGLGTLVNTGILVILYHYAHLALVAASAVATELTIGHNFLWNNYWTFGRRGGVSLGRFARFNLVSLAGQCVTIATLWALTQHSTLSYVVANIAGIGLALVWNFTVNVRWTWGRRN